LEFETLVCEYVVMLKDFRNACHAPIGRGTPNVTDRERLIPDPQLRADMEKDPTTHELVIVYGDPKETSSFVDAIGNAQILRNNDGDIVSKETLEVDEDELWPDDEEEKDKEERKGEPIVKRASGLRNNYYLVRVNNPQREDQVPYTAECEDIIEALGLNFDEANMFKEIWRSANARTHGNAKIGHSAIYGAEKLVHYAGRILRRMKRSDQESIGGQQ
jgi:hypothetical protein